MAKTQDIDTGMHKLFIVSCTWYIVPLCLVAMVMTVECNYPLTSVIVFRARYEVATGHCYHGNSSCTQANGPEAVGCLDPLLPHCLRPLSSTPRPLCGQETDSASCHTHQS